jgi:hypothetical protein
MRRSLVQVVTFERVVRFACASPEIGEHGFAHATFSKILAALVDAAGAMSVGADGDSSQRPPARRANDKLAMRRWRVRVAAPILILFRAGRDTPWRPIT